MCRESCPSWLYRKHGLQALCWVADNCNSTLSYPVVWLVIGYLILSRLMVVVEEEVLYRGNCHVDIHGKSMWSLCCGTVYCINVQPYCYHCR